jgi:hypothetical protein
VYIFFRPVDPLLLALLAGSVDLSSQDDVERWLGFVVVALPILTAQSPEEGILGRLEEIVIQGGGGGGGNVSESGAGNGR